MLKEFIELIEFISSHILSKMFDTRYIEHTIINLVYLLSEMSPFDMLFSIFVKSSPRAHNS